MACFLVSAAEAVVVTAAKKTVDSKPEEAGKISFARKLRWLANMLWGASLMWLGDAIFEYAEIKSEYFSPSPADMINDGFLGLSVIALAMVIWVAYILIKDPKGTVRTALFKTTK